MKRNSGNIFGLFVFWKEEIRTRTIKKAFLLGFTEGKACCCTHHTFLLGFPTGQ
jgi:hypothetical protein